jgi:hypothetical protein
MIVASLAVISITVLLLFLHQQRGEAAHMRGQGASLVRRLSRIPFEQFVPGSGMAGTLTVLQRTRSISALAYLAMMDGQGRPVEEITGAGMVVPSAPLPADPTTWSAIASCCCPATAEM